MDQNDEIVPQVAASVAKINELVWDVALKPGYKFSDGTAVDAQRVAACLSELNEKNSNAQSSLGKMTVTAADDLTVRITSERPTHVMDAVLAEWVFVVFLKTTVGDVTDFAYTGPYKIDEFKAGEKIELVPNQYYYDGRALERPQITVKSAADGHELAEGLKSGEVDIGFRECVAPSSSLSLPRPIAHLGHSPSLVADLPVDTLSELEELEDILVKSFEVGYHYMAFHNIATLPDVRVRKAIDLAIDRAALSEALEGGKGTRSLFPDYSPYFADDTEGKADPTAAATLLDEAGWTLDADGARAKDGTPLTVHIVAYPHRPGLAIMQPVIAKALEDLGISTTTTLTGDDWSETQAHIDDGSFDLLLWAQHTLPAGDPLWFLSAFFRSDGGNNHAGFESNDVDRLLDELSVAEDHATRVKATETVHKAILDEAPVSNLVTPYWHVGLSQRMANYSPWGSDYYVIRPDLFISEVTTASDTQETGTAGGGAQGGEAGASASSGASSSSGTADKEDPSNGDGSGGFRGCVTGGTRATLLVAFWAVLAF